MIIVRPPSVEDGPLLRAKAQIYAATMYPELIPDIEKIHWLIRSATNEREANYSRVVGEPGKPQAALLTRTENNLWAMRKHASILLWYSEIPLVGALLLRGFRDWVKAQLPQIVLAGFNADWAGTDERALRLAERIGFRKRGGGGYMYFPKGRFA